MKFPKFPVGHDQPPLQYQAGLKVSLLMPPADVHYSSDYISSAFFHSEIAPLGALNHKEAKQHSSTFSLELGSAPESDTAVSHHGADARPMCLGVSGRFREYGICGTPVEPAGA
jgi:hypothetical protein